MVRGTAVIYARISQDRTGKEHGVARQREDCLKLAAEKGLRVVDVVVDNDVSAYSGKRREGWRRVLEMIDSGEVDTLIAHHVDRMYRQVKDLLELVEILKYRDVGVITVKSGDIDLSTSAGRMQAGIGAQIAQTESEQKAERIARAHLQLAEAGQPKGGRRPWGYGIDHITIVEPEAEAIRDAAEMIVDGRTLRAAADHVTARMSEQKAELSVLLPDGAVKTNMSRTALREVLLSPRIAGYRSHLPQRERERLRRMRARSATRGGFPWNDLVCYPAVWKGILTEDMWRAVRGILLDPERIGGKKRPRRSMLASLLRCGRCLKDMGEDGEPVVSTLGYGPKGYTCARCGSVSVHPAPIENLIATKVRERLARSPEIFLEDPGLQSEEHLLTRQELAERKRQGLVEMYVRHPGATTALDAGLAQVEAELAAISAERDERDRQILLRRRAHSLLDAWDESDAVTRGTLIGIAADYFVIEPLGRTGCSFQPGRVIAHWADAPDEPERLGPQPRTQEDIARERAARDAEKEVLRLERDKAAELRYEAELERFHQREREREAELTAQLGRAPDPLDLARRGPANPPKERRGSRRNGRQSRG
ncbi:hypothetical protein B8281_16050 [Cellulosimicrobium sp. TH-20]|uniref:recombinase family protein n=1 Tax=Cellulosimicrobium sp. TH-20 TaxID=1980001 RepID=UPI000A17AFBD|nr:recombinase family protein [Cellulosimicrobium sp. TH-20]ARK06005.1 hypothetical protein B8281_16050 [Cellulosimicrobium sp. TH-20]